MSSWFRARSTTAAILVLAGLGLGCELFGNGPTAPAAGRQPAQPTDPTQLEVIASTGFEAGTVGVDNWSQTDTPTGQQASVFEVTDVKSHTGARSLRLFAGRRSGAKAAKAYLRKTGFDVATGDVFQASAYFWFPDNDGTGAEQHRGRFLMDLECGVCGPKGAPGIRLHVGDGGALQTESKWSKTRDDRGVLAHGDMPIPLQQWFEITWRVRLGSGSEGNVTALLNGHETLNANGTTIAPKGLEQLDRYNTFEIGLTANGRESPTEIYLDDVLVERSASPSATESTSAQPLLQSPQQPESEGRRFRGDGRPVDQRTDRPE